MALLPIRIAPDPVLKATAERVAAVDGAVARLMDDMLETMYDAPGIGLAAPQVGVLKRVIVIDTAGKDEPAQPLFLANPELVWVSEDLSGFSEGCLSFPDLYADVVRPAECRVRYLDRTNTPQELHATDLLATCVQHEIDHLDGILFTDHLSQLKRSSIMRKLAKWKKAQAAA